MMLFLVEFVLGLQLEEKVCFPWNSWLSLLKLVSSFIWCSSRTIIDPPLRSISSNNQWNEKEDNYFNSLKMITVKLTKWTYSAEKSSKKNHLHLLLTLPKDGWIINLQSICHKTFRCPVLFFSHSLMIIHHFASSGEIYLAFFNLNPEKTTISASISDLAKALPGRNLKVGSCKGSEVWSGKDLGIIGGSVSMTVEMHGCALFVLKCISSS